MKAWQRVLLKTIIFLLVVAAAGGSVAGWRAYQQSTPRYAIDRYLTLLLDNSTDRAFALLDQSEEEQLSPAAYASVTEEKKYALYSSFVVKELENRRDSRGNEYVDFQAEFLDADHTVQAAEEFTVKKQPEAVFGIFDKWKVLSGHCMVKNFLLTVPAGSQVYLDGELADTSWITADSAGASAERYQIPDMLPGTVSLAIRHEALESLNTTLNASEGSADCTGQMPLKESAKSECLEMGIDALKQLYAGAAAEKTKNLDELLELCMDDAKRFVKNQGAALNQEGVVFKTMGLSEFKAQFGDPVFTEEETGAITSEMELAYHYTVQTDVTTDTGEYDEEGNLIQDVNTGSDSGDNTARFTMAFYDGEWHIAALEIPVIG